MTEQDIRDVMKQLPGLSDNGMPYHEYADQQADFERRLLESAAECTMIEDWLGGVRTTKSLFESSYALKHAVENQFRLDRRPITYVSNGQFIAAAVYCKVPYEIIPGTPNVRFGISKKWLKAKAQGLIGNPHPSFMLEIEQLAEAVDRNPLDQAAINCCIDWLKEKGLDEVAKCLRDRLVYSRAPSWFVDDGFKKTRIELCTKPGAKKRWRSVVHRDTKSHVRLIDAIRRLSGFPRAMYSMFTSVD